MLSGAAVDVLKNSQISEIIITNTLPVPQEKQFDKLTVLSIAPLLARAINEVFSEERLRDQPLRRPELKPTVPGGRARRLWRSRPHGRSRTPRPGPPPQRLRTVLATWPAPSIPTKGQDRFPPHPPR